MQIKVIVLNMDKRNVFAVFDNLKSAEASLHSANFNSLTIDDVRHLSPLTSDELSSIYNSITGNAPARNRDKIRADTWKAIQSLDIGPVNASASRSKIKGGKIEMLPGWDEVKFHAGSQRERCLAVIAKITQRGKRKATVKAYVKKAVETAGITEAQAMACLGKLNNSSIQLV